jgi:hypothetical protein
MVARIQSSSNTTQQRLKNTEWRYNMGWIGSPIIIMIVAFIISLYKGGGGTSQ